MNQYNIIVGGKLSSLIFVALRQIHAHHLFLLFLLCKYNLYGLLVNLINFELKCQALIAIVGQGC